MRTIVETSKGYVLVDTWDTPDHGLETMVLSCTEGGNVISYSDLDVRNYATIQEAIEGHWDLVGKWRNK